MTHRATMLRPARGQTLARLDSQAAQVSLDAMEIEVKVAQQKVA